MVPMVQIQSKDGGMEAWVLCATCGTMPAIHHRNNGEKWVDFVWKTREGHRIRVTVLDDGEIEPIEPRPDDHSYGYDDILGSPFLPNLDGPDTPDEKAANYR